MNGLELRKLLKINLLTHEQAAILFGVTRETVSRWCQSEEELPVKSQKKITLKLREKSMDVSIISHGNGNIVNNGNMSDASIDNRQYYSSDPDVLQAQIKMLEERILHLEAQLVEKDSQINKLLDIMKKN